MLKHSCMQRAKIHLERQEQDIVIQCPDIYLRKAIINSQDGQKRAMVQWTLHELTLDKHMGQVMT
jgi:hypothetical protein